MITVHRIQYLIILAIALCCLGSCIQSSQVNSKPSSYYLSSNGNDAGNGSQQQPWKTIEKLNGIHLKAGDQVFLEGGKQFSGTLHIDSTETGSSEKPIRITSYGTGKSTIVSGNGEGIIVDKSTFVQLSNLKLKGSGRKQGNTKYGLGIFFSENVSVDSVEISGYQKAGLLIYSSRAVKAKKVHAHDNGFAGISIEGENQQFNSRDILLQRCIAENNPGDPSNLTNHSGNGIIVSSCRNVTIEYCTAANNGWDMPRKGNGPVGIWAYEADNVLIQYCISYHNKTSQGSSHGGGFDLDGGVKNSTVQYCLSYGNAGAGYGIFQYDGAGDWYNNHIRNCISENDGMGSNAKAGIFIWNASKDASQFRDCYITNNIVYSDIGAALSYEEDSEHSSFHFSNNIFVAKEGLVRNWKMERGSSYFTGNNWWSLYDRFNIDGILDFRKWATRYNKELKDGKLAGANTDPGFKSPGNTTLTNPYELKKFDAYHSALIEKGMGVAYAQ